MFLFLQDHLHKIILYFYLEWVQILLSFPNQINVLLFGTRTLSPNDNESHANLTGLLVTANTTPLALSVQLFPKRKRILTVVVVHCEAIYSRAKDANRESYAQSKQQPTALQQEMFVWFARFALVASLKDATSMSGILSGSRAYG